MKALLTVNGNTYSWEWDKLIPKDAGIDVAYINTLIDQINSGMYEELFLGTEFKYGGFPNVKHDSVFLDIGANLGLVSIYAAPICKQVVAVEPAPNVLPILYNLVRPFPNIRVIPIALDKEDGDKQMFINDINFTASSTENTYGKPVMVKCAKLSTILQAEDLSHVDVCKIDAEGAEGESLDYYQINNAKDIIDTWYVETHNCPKTGWEHKLGTLAGNFARCGYQHMEVNGMALLVKK